MIFSIFIILLTFLIYYLILSPYIQLLKIKLQFGNQALMNFIPILGDFFEIQRSNWKYSDRFEIFRKYFRDNKQVKFLLMNIYNIPYVIVGDPQYNKEIYLNHDNYRKFDVLLFNTTFLNEGVLFSIGEQWKKQRQILGKPFDYDKLKARVPMFNRIVKDALNKMNTFANVLEFTRCVAGNAVIQSFFGEEVKDAKLNGKPVYHEIVQLFDEIGEIIFSTMYGFLKWVILADKQWKFFPTKRERDVVRRVHELNHFAEKVIDDRINQIQKNGFNQNVDDDDLLDVHLREYLQKNNKSIIQREQIVSQFITLYFVGTDTTSSLAAICLFYLAQHKNVYDAILSEIEKVVGNGDVHDVHLPKLQEMTSFIWEVLRFKNPVSGPVIRVVKEDHMLKDLKLKKGWMILPANYVQQTTDKYFDNCQEFDHLRFLKENTIQNDNGYVNVPFSGGPRNCIGQHMSMMEIKIILCHILRKYNIVPVEEKLKNVTWKSKLLYMFEPLDCIKLIEKK